MQPKTFRCSLCGSVHPASQMNKFDGQTLCYACLESETTLCDRCGDRIWQSDDCGDGNVTLCHRCEESYYGHCSDCGRLVANDDMHYLSDTDSDGYCSTCYGRHAREQGVHSYCYKPEPIFYGDGPRFLGVELEIDGGGESDYNANLIVDVGNRDQDHIYIKHDGSLDEGLEIVTHPMTLNYHTEVMPWREVLRKALELDYTSHQAGTCGLHVHVNRSSLGETSAEQEGTIARILFLVENFWNELLRFSRRTQRQLDRWATRYGRKDDPKAVLRSAKSNSDRYTCVNLTPYYTIEFRIFRGTLKYNTLIATLQLVERICHVAFYLTDDEIKSVTWSEFVSGVSKEAMPELIQYLKERRLYVNEPVPAAEEV